VSTDRASNATGSLWLTRGMGPPFSAAAARLMGQASDGGSEGMAGLLIVQHASSTRSLRRLERDLAIATELIATFATL